MVWVDVNGVDMKNHVDFVEESVGRMYLRFVFSRGLLMLSWRIHVVVVCWEEVFRYNRGIK